MILQQELIVTPKIQVCNEQHYISIKCTDLGKICRKNTRRYNDLYVFDFFICFILCVFFFVLTPFLYKDNNHEIKNHRVNFKLQSRFLLRCKKSCGF